MMLPVAAARSSLLRSVVPPLAPLRSAKQCKTTPASPDSTRSRSEYDRGVNTFSPEGRLFQVEYAIEAIKIGTTAIGICTDEGVIIAVEKRLLSPLQEPGSVEKIYEVDSHIGVAMSGLSADARTLVDHARSEAQYHRFTFNEPMPVESLTQAVCDLALAFGESGEEKAMSRPFGVALLIAGWDHKGPCLFHTDPSGTFTRFDAKAIGAGSEGAQTALQEQFHKKLTLEEAETMAVSILKQVMEEKLDASNVEVACVKLPPATAEVPLTAACHYVPGAKRLPQYTPYSKTQLEAILARVTPAAAS